ncbi:hypothetical protein RQP46_003000 [Phenoliferia psychrophenolica]
MLSRVLPRLPHRPLAHPIPAFASSSSSSLLFPPTQSRSASSSSAPKRISRSSQIKDELIPHPLITLVDPISNELLPPAKLSDLLIALDRARFSILLVDPSHDPPICKILDKKAAYTKALEKKDKDRESAAAAQAAGGPVTGAAAGGPAKEVHITWGVTSHDLSHKLGKAKELLGKGHRVTVVINDKKGVAAVAARVRADVIKGVETQLEGVGKLKKQPTNKGAQVFMEFQAPVA